MGNQLNIIQYGNAGYIPDIDYCIICGKHGVMGICIECSPKDGDE